MPKTKKSDTTEMEPIKLHWKANVRTVFDEILQNNDSMWIMKHPLNITYAILQRAAQRAAELGDEEMIGYMCRLGMYTFADPFHPDYDEKLAEKFIQKTK